MRTRRIALPDVELEIAEAAPASGGGRPLLLVHGFTGTKEDFTDYLDLLAALGWHAVAPDLRGHGASAHPEGQESYSLALFAADLVALSEALGWRSFSLLGHSMGGMVAQVVALEVPERLAGLILMDTSHGNPDGIDPAMVALGRSVVADGGISVLVELQRELDDPLSSPAYERLCATRAGYRAWTEAKTLAASSDMWMAMTEEMLDQKDRLDALGSLSTPTLVIVGEQDAGFIEHSRRMAEAIPKARLAVIAHAGHSPQFEAPEQWWQEVAGFLAGVAGT
jgi:pimeloyl-ACP methyl ester carboxylesterase